MRFRCIIAAALLGLSLQAQAFAADNDPLARLDAGVLFKGAISEGDVSLLFAYLRSAVVAAAAGREPPPVPEELNKRAEALGDELKMRGALTALLLLSALEASAKQMLREPAPRRALPPVTPFTPVSAD